MSAVWLGAWLCILAAVTRGQVVQVTPLVTFDGANGKRVVAPLTQGPNGDFYGMTGLGGSNGNGTIFKVNTNGTFTSLFSFGTLVPNGNGVGTNDTGVGPSVPLTLGPDGNFYGMTEAGGTNGNGTIFKVTTNGTISSLLSFGMLLPNGDSTNGNFGTNATGAQPITGLTPGTDGNFYGSTPYGGLAGEGTVFKATTNGTITSLYSFSTLYPGTSRLTNDDGSQIAGNLLPGPGGVFYATPSNGGIGGAGAICTVTTSGTLTDLYSFSPLIANKNAEGGDPFGLTWGSDGNLYGVNYIGGVNGDGTVYRVALATLNIQLLTGKAVVTWTNSAYGLQSAPAVTGTYTNIPGATSPYTNTIPVSQQFFRLVGN